MPQQIPQVRRHAAGAPEKGLPVRRRLPGRAEHGRTRLQPHEAPPQGRHPPRRDLPRQPPAHPHRHPPEIFYNFISDF